MHVRARVGRVVAQNMPWDGGWGALPARSRGPRGGSPGLTRRAKRAKLPIYIRLLLLLPQFYYYNDNDDVVVLVYISI